MSSLNDPDRAVSITNPADYICTDVHASQRIRPLLVREYCTLIYSGYVTNSVRTVPTESCMGMVQFYSKLWFNNLQILMRIRMRMCGKMSM